MKFVIYTDWKAQAGGGYEYEMIEAKDLEEAIDIADMMWSDKQTYLMRIMKKVGKIEKDEGEGWKKETFEAVLCRRSFGWHRNTKENSENEHKIERHFHKDIEYFA